MIKSGTPFFQRSPKLVQPIPIMATLSFIVPISSSSLSHWLALPSVGSDVSLPLQPPEGHLHRLTDLQVLDVAKVRHFKLQPRAVLEVNNRPALRRVGDLRNGGDGVCAVAIELNLLRQKLDLLEVVLGVALGADSANREIQPAALLALAGMQLVHGIPLSPQLRE